MVQRFWPAFMMVLVGAFVLGFGGALLLRADGGGSDSSQTFGASRYALLNGEVMVSAMNTVGPIKQDAVFRIDTVTGQVWVLQMTVQSNNQPQVVSAKFVPTTILTGTDSNTPANPAGVSPLQMTNPYAE